MTVWVQVADVAGMVCLVLGALLCFVAGIGLLRLSDVLSRLHAATKPQSLGLLLVLLGVALRLRSGIDMGSLALVGFFILTTTPVAAHMVGRAAYRTGQVTSADLVRDELDERLSEPGHEGRPESGPGDSPGESGAGGGPGQNGAGGGREESGSGGPTLTP